MLQWSRNFSVADWIRLSFWMPCSSPLQWSRNFSVADCGMQSRRITQILCFNGAATFQLRIVANTRRTARRPCQASMEPQLFSCGLCYTAVASWVDKRVASMEPQLFSCGLLLLLTIWLMKFFLLQWSRNFSVADCVPQIGSIWGGDELQWSRNFSVADCGKYPTTTTPSGWASMEPQLFSCGLNKLARGGRTPNSRFNGAATFQLRIACPKLVQSGVAMSFNGAATFQLRIVENIQQQQHQADGLQWSRNFSVADWTNWREVVGLPIPASMEPQLFSCGLLKIWICIMFFSPGFNGAATFQLRIDR